MLQIRDVPIVGVTCLSVARSPILRSRLFDVCILDEASQVTLPASLGPLLRCRTFVLVGDHLQLPPLVQSSKAQVWLHSTLVRAGIVPSFSWHVHESRHVHA
jgi:DNA replication ATP-dependent helicase Dna2